MHAIKGSNYTIQVPVIFNLYVTRGRGGGLSQNK